MPQKWLALIIIIACSVVCSTAVCQTPRDLSWLTQAERDWLADHPKIRIAPTPDYPPFEFWNTDGDFRGVVASYLDYFSETLDIEFELVQTERWSDNLAQLKSKEIDAVSLIVAWSDRNYVAVSKPYISYPSLIIVRKDHPGGLSLGDLDEMRVAVPNDYTGEYFLRMAYPELEIVEADDPAHGVRMLSTGEVDAYFGGSSVVAHVARREGISNLRIAGETDFIYANCFGVRDDWKELAGIISKTLDRMDLAKHREFHDTWIERDFFFKKRFYESRRFWWILGSALSALILGSVSVLFWNRRQAILIEQLEAAKKRNDVVNQKLEHSRREAEAANEAKSKFVANMSHEIRTPMSGVLGMCELLKGTRLNAKQREYLNLASHSAENLLSLINDVLDIAKVEAGQLELEERPFSVDATVKGVIDLMHTKSDPKGLKIIFNRNDDVAPIYIGDELRIRQILINLISNAVKFTPKGEINVNVSRVARDDVDENSADAVETEAAHLIRFEVKDSGGGIAPDRIGEIFKPFKQEDASITRRYGGTGLGLSICKTLAEMMGGSADVRSEIGVGSVFGFTVLLQPTEAVLEPREHVAAPNPVRNFCRVLLVEDGLVNQRVAIGLLEKRGHKVDLVESGEKALESIEKNDYDVVLMDIELPNMDGLTAVGRIRDREQTTGLHQWVVAMTAHAMSGDKERFIEAGMDGHLVKPYKPYELYAAVEQPGNNGDSKMLNNIPILDEAAALENAGGDAELVNLLRETCLQEAPNIIAQAKSAVGESDWKTARRSGHSLRSSFGAIGAMAASAKSAEMEMVAEDDASQFQQAIESVEAAFQQLVDELKI